MLLAGAVVEQHLLLRRLAHVLGRDRRAARRACERRRDLQRIERAPRVARAKAHQLDERLVLEREPACAQAALGVAERPARNRRDILVAERAQHQHAGAREQRRDYLEGRILGGRADERDEPAFDVGQDGVLLRAVPSMDLVDENHRAPPAGFQLAPRLFDRLAQLGDSRRHRRDRAKAAPDCCASKSAIVVLPLPGGPHRMIDGSAPAASIRLSILSGPSRCSWPTTSSRLRGRIRSANG